MVPAMLDAAREGARVIDRLLDRGTWRDEAACRKSDPEMWYSDDTYSGIAARTICGDCPVRVDCLRDGITDPFGIWGGWSAAERRRLRERMRGLDKEAKALIIEQAAITGPRHLKLSD